MQSHFNVICLHDEKTGHTRQLVDIANRLIRLQNSVCAICPTSLRGLFQHCETLELVPSEQEDESTSHLAEATHSSSHALPMDLIHWSLYHSSVVLKYLPSLCEHHREGRLRKGIFVCDALLYSQLISRVAAQMNCPLVLSNSLGVAVHQPILSLYQPVLPGFLSSWLKICEPLPWYHLAELCFRTVCVLRRLVLMCKQYPLVLCMLISGSYFRVNKTYIKLKKLLDSFCIEFPSSHCSTCAIVAVSYPRSLLSIEYWLQDRLFIGTKYLFATGFQRNVWNQQVHEVCTGLTVLRPTQNKGLLQNSLVGEFLQSMSVQHVLDNYDCFALFFKKHYNGVVLASFGNNTSMQKQNTAIFSTLIAVCKMLGVGLIFQGAIDPSGRNMSQHCSQSAISCTWLPLWHILKNLKPKVIICHGGHRTLVEAIATETPILCAPQYCDQFMNSRLVQKLRIGDSLHHYDELLHTAKVTNGIKSIFSDTHTIHKNLSACSETLLKSCIEDQELSVFMRNIFKSM
mmetsp:Transcript_9996/g.34832  ORF Transcript_9996/g.34832 Transcript_9996/m.34832 type:complete len:514 (+) Transcript_9996:132-1673(+)